MEKSKIWHDMGERPATQYVKIYILNEDNYIYFITDGLRVTKRLIGGGDINLTDVAHLVNDINPKHIEAMIALNKLFTIAQAWNKEDGFVPDFSDWEQDKWFPWFVYNKDAAEFVYANTDGTPSSASADFGSRLCFKSYERAAQFGTQFADLYNKVFL